MSRACDCPFEKGDDPSVTCSFRKKIDMQRLLEEADPSDLKEWSLLYHHNAFEKIDMGENIHGIWGASTVDMLHAFRHGIVKYVLHIFFEDNLTPKGRNAIDRYVRQLTSGAKQSGDKSFPRTSFPHGVTSLAYTTHAEKIGILMLLVFMLSSQDGLDELEPLWYGQLSLRNDWLYLFEMLLCFDAWTHNGKMWRLTETAVLPHEETSCREAISTILFHVKEISPREEACRWKITKFHEQLHLPSYITM